MAAAVPDSRVSTGKKLKRSLKKKKKMKVVARTAVSMLEKEREGVSDSEGDV